MSDAPEMSFLAELHPEKDFMSRVVLQEAPGDRILRLRAAEAVRREKLARAEEIEARHEFLDHPGYDSMDRMLTAQQHLVAALSDAREKKSHVPVQEPWRTS